MTTREREMSASALYSLYAWLTCVGSYGESLLLRPGMATKYCDICVCRSVGSHISKITRPNCTTFSVHVTCGRGLVLLWRLCDRLCTSGFVDDVMRIIHRVSPGGAGGEVCYRRLSRFIDPYRGKSCTHWLYDW